jgi:uncharacterized membrane protein YbhN (UPF0104 family)
MSATLGPGQTAGEAASQGPRPRRAARAASRPRANPVVSVRRRLISALVLATATLTLVLAVPPLRGAAHQIGAMNPAWVVAAVALEVASCAGYVVVFRWFFDEVPPGPARDLAWTEQASGALLPTGGLGALAIGGAFATTGHAISLDVLILGYILGYIANLLPVPGGFGILEAGLAGTLILYGAPAIPAAAAVIVYHAIAFWVPSLGGLAGYARLRRANRARL